MLILLPFVENFLWQNPIVVRQHLQLVQNIFKKLKTYQSAMYLTDHQKATMQTYKHFLKMNVLNLS